METEFIYWRHHTLPGIKVEEVCGAEDKPLKLWLEMARQVYCENGREAYREIGHYHSGAPFLMGESTRISITHSGRFFAVATLPPTPEVDLAVFSERAALGIDAEKGDRDQVLKVRDRFMNSDELQMIPKEDVKANVMAWTAKEALLKASMNPEVDIREDLVIVSLPKIGPAVTVYDHEKFDPIRTGEGRVRIAGDWVRLVLYSYESEGYIVTLAYSPKCAKFSKE